ncbi:MAG: PilZ domain-containing protein [Desulfobacterales bacterium]|nr:PilZ domain-containing protein [Desulfobacterales bacterium]
MKVTKIIHGNPGERLSFTCGNCREEKSFVARPDAGRKRVLKCGCGARIGLVVERRKHRRLTPPTPAGGVISDGEMFYDMRIKDASHGGLGLELGEMNTNLSKGANAKIVFSSAGLIADIVKDTIEIVSIREKRVGARIRDHSSSQRFFHGLMRARAA